MATGGFHEYGGFGVLICGVKFSRREAGSETARSDDRAPFLERPVALVTLVGGLLGIITAALAIIGLLGNTADSAAEMSAPGEN
jgi:hypothetical protein